ncbi:hypothetical protein JZM24_06610 [Candidatus Sodalis endolongispinus]|uniref:Transposase n=1 Tax=Candidatus Sodalis endolongispinus TaxID=2812662 RepID=A0ABS5YA77_9GAMM|nr:hypothetical protein [Candidatus Sodalis endolongispinus]MBT9431892.1 hypothetical protein [Candidatus Sodalis endolongispinus]
MLYHIEVNLNAEPGTLRHLHQGSDSQIRELLAEDIRRTIQLQHRARFCHGRYRQRDGAGQMQRGGKGDGRTPLAAFTHYNENHPHSALGYHSPREYRR